MPGVPTPGRSRLETLAAEANLCRVVGALLVRHFNCVFAFPVCFRLIAFESFGLIVAALEITLDVLNSNRLVRVKTGLISKVCESFACMGYIIDLVFVLLFSQIAFSYTVFPSAPISNYFSMHVCFKLSKRRKAYHVSLLLLL